MADSPPSDIQPSQANTPETHPDDTMESQSQPQLQLASDTVGDSQIAGTAVDELFGDISDDDNSQTRVTETATPQHSSNDQTTQTTQTAQMINITSIESDSDDVFSSSKQGTNKRALDQTFEALFGEDSVSEALADLEKELPQQAEPQKEDEIEPSQPETLSQPAESESPSKITKKRKPPKETRASGPPLELHLSEDQRIPLVGREVAFVKLPNLLSIETTPFHPSHNQSNLMPKHRILQNVIRWRLLNGKLQSNARVVKWSDGSQSVFIGNQQIDLSIEDLLHRQDYLFQHFTNFNQPLMSESSSSSDDDNEEEIEEAFREQRMRDKQLRAMRRQQRLMEREADTGAEYGIGIFSKKYRFLLQSTHRVRNVVSETKHPKIKMVYGIDVNKLRSVNEDLAKSEETKARKVRAAAERRRRKQAELNSQFLEEEEEDEDEKRRRKRRRREKEESSEAEMDDHIEESEEESEEEDSEPERLPRTRSRKRRKEGSEEEQSEEQDDEDENEDDEEQDEVKEKENEKKVGQEKDNKAPRSADQNGDQNDEQLRRKQQQERMQRMLAARKQKQQTTKQSTQTNLPKEDE